MLKAFAQALALLLALLSGSVAMATPILTGTWYVGAFGGPGETVIGTGPGAGGENPGDPAWTFTIADDHVLTVLDCCAVGDTFKVFDGADLLGTTAPGSAGGECFSALDCDTNPAAGRGDFLLGPGTFSLTMVVDVFGGLGNLFFIVRDVPDRVPEPHTLAIVATALLGVVAARRRRRG